MIRFLFLSVNILLFDKLYDLFLLPNNRIIFLIFTFFKEQSDVQLKEIWGGKDKEGEKSKSNFFPVSFLCSDFETAKINTN